MRCFALPCDPLPRMQASERSADRVEFPVSYILDKLRIPLIFPHLFVCHTIASVSRFILWHIPLATSESNFGEWTRGKPCFHAVERRGDWVGQGKSQTSGRLEFGLHNDVSYPLSLGWPDPRKFQTKTFAFDPPYQGFVDAQRPFLVMKEQG